MSGLPALSPDAAGRDLDQRHQVADGTGKGGGVAAEPPLRKRLPSSEPAEELPHVIYGSSAPHARSCEPPPEWPMTANRSMPSASATLAASPAANATSRFGTGSTCRSRDGRTTPSGCRAGPWPRKGPGPTIRVSLPAVALTAAPAASARRRRTLRGAPQTAGSAPAPRRRPVRPPPARAPLRRP
jgi:hypothetical protein